MDFLLESLKLRRELLRTTVTRAKEMLEGAPHYRSSRHMRKVYS